MSGQRCFPSRVSFLKALTEALKGVGRRRFVGFGGKPRRLLAAGSAEYGWKGVADIYDQVIEIYGDWILENSAGADQVTDLQTPIVKFLKQQRNSRPTIALLLMQFTLNSEGHHIAAKAILPKWKVE